MTVIAPAAPQATTAPAPLPKFLYRVSYTESEAGWGSRPDGCSYAIDLQSLRVEIHRQEGVGDHECYIRAETPGIVEVTEKLYQEALKSPTRIVNTFRNPHEGDLTHSRRVPARVTLE